MRPLIATAAILAAASAYAAEWEPTTAALVKAEKPGFGGVTGVVVDRATGDVYVWVSDRGLYRSTDQARTFARLGKPHKGRTEWPGCMMTDPASMKTWVVALVYGEPILSSTDGAASFAAMDNKSQHVDWAAVDWGTRQFVLTLKHESGELLLASNDGGKKFREVGKGYGPGCVFDDKTAVVVRLVSTGPRKPPRGELVRTTDGAKTFEKVADHATKALPVWHGKAPYWLVDGGIVTSKDAGRTWQSVASVKGGQFGPVFGKDEKQMFVLTAAGVVETTDGGKTWSAPLAPPKAMKGLGPLSWVGYDAKNDVLYLMKMGSDLYRMKRAAAR